MLISLSEIIDILVMTFAVGFIFMDVLKQFRPLRIKYSYGFDWSALKLACFVTAPALILHELFHKFVAIAFGLSAVFHASYGWLFFGVVLKLLNSPFLFFVPAYVSIGCDSLNCVIQPLNSALVAFAGPFANLSLFLLAKFVLEHKRLSFKTKIVVHVSKQINLFLFIFNMLPFPPFDGFKVYEGLFYFVKSVM